MALLAGFCLSGASFAQSPPPGMIISNTASVDYADANGNALPPARASVQTPVAGQSVLVLTKVGSANPVEAGNTITYTLAYENPGGVAATNVVLTDQLAPELQFQSASHGGSHLSLPAGGTVTWDLGVLAPGDRGAVSVIAVVNPSAPGGTLIYNSANITSGEGAFDQATLTTEVGSRPNLELSKSGTGGPAAPGGTLSYGIRYRNTGNQTATGVQVRDTLPAGVVFVGGSASGGGSLQGDTVIWDLGTVQPGEEGEVSFRVTVSYSVSDGDFIRNRSTIQSNEQATLRSNDVVNLVSTSTTQPALSFTKTDSPDPVFVNNPLSYEIRIRNDGTGPLTDVVIRDPLPANTTFISADGGGGPVGNEILWQIDTLAPGESRALHLVVRVDADTLEGAVIQNQATAVAAQIPHPSPTTTTTVSERTPARVLFVDPAGNPVERYQMGDAVCIRVADRDQNKNASLPETVSVELVPEQSGDRETLILTETDVDTGLFEGCLPSTSAMGNPNDGSLTVLRDSMLLVTYTDPFDAVPVSRESALIDPLGIVFDSSTGDPVEGSVVSLLWVTGPGTSAPAGTHPLWPAGQADSVTTGTDGAYAFPLVPPGAYFLHLSPGSGFSFPSSVPDAELPPGQVIGTGSRGEIFTLAAGDPPLVLDVPVDAEAGLFALTKTGNKTIAAIGDLITYYVKLTHAGAGTLRNVKVLDTLPHGVQYLAGSTRIQGKKAPDPSSNGRQTMTWEVPDIPANGSLELVYRAVIGVDSQRGDGINRALAQATSGGRPVQSNTARFKVKITGGVLTWKGTVIGKVFLDSDSSRIQKPIELNPGMASSAQPLPGKVMEIEPGIPGVVLYLEDGTRVVTDKDGKYSIYGVDPGTHVIRLDETTLPDGLEPVPVSNRFVGDATSQFVDMVPSGLFKANFAVREKREGPASRRETGEKENTSEMGGKTRAGTTPVAVSEEPLDLERAILKMNPDLEILSPKQGTLLSGTHVNVVVKAALGAGVTLRVNGREIGEDRIGKKITHPGGRVVIYEYVSLELAEGRTNRVVAQMKDPFGNIRGTTSVEIFTVGRPHEIVIKPGQTEAPADGRSVVPLDVTVFDRNQNPVSRQKTVTVYADAGDVLEKDVDPATAGLQIPCENGSARVSLKAPYETGTAEVTVLSAGLKEKATVHFVPHLRDMMVVGLGEVTLGYGKSKGNTGPLKNDTGFDEDLYADGRGAGFVKGRVYKDILLTAAYDSEKEEAEDLFRTRDSDLESEDKYPIYGDESNLGYEALSKEKLYMRLEKNRSYFLFGDYETELNQTTIAAYNRSFNGVKWDVDTDFFDLRSFVSRADQIQVVDVVRGRGISGFYFLQWSRMVEGSESVDIETRDRRRVDRVLERQHMVRWSDYTVDYGTGALMFKSPVPSYDEAFNPVYIVVTYETEEGAAEHYKYGGRAAVKPAEWIELGVTGITEEKDADDDHLYGGDVTLRLPKNTFIKAEWAESESFLDMGGETEQKRDSGWGISLESDPFEAYHVSAYYRRVGDFFENPSAVDVSRGTEKYGMEALLRPRSDVLVRAAFFDENDVLNDADYDHVSLGVEKTFKKTKVKMEVLRETSDDRFVSSNSLSTREPFDISEETPDDLVAVRGAVETEILPRLSILLAHRQDVKHNGYNLTQAGLTYQIDDLTSAYVRQEYGKYEDRKESHTLIGTESRVAKNTVTFSEYRLAGGADGTRNQQVLGLRNKFMLGPYLTGNLALENLHTMSGLQRSGEPDAFGASTALEYLPHERLRMSTRVEYRMEKSEPRRRNRLVELGLARKLGPDYSLLLKERYTSDDLGGNGGERIMSRTSVGLAYRPVEMDRLNALAKMEFKREEDTVLTPGIRTDAYIASVEGAYQIGRRLQFMGKYAGKLVNDDDLDNYSDLLSGRIIYDITDRLDMGAEYRILNSHDLGSMAQGGSLEIGYRVVKNLWVSLGYGFDDFDSDLTLSNYTGKGPFLRVRFKFNEHLFK